MDGAGSGFVSNAKPYFSAIWKSMAGEPIILVGTSKYGEVLICLARPPIFGEKPIFLKKRRYVW